MPPVPISDHIPYRTLPFDYHLSTHLPPRPILPRLHPSEGNSVHLRPTNSVHGLQQGYSAHVLKNACASFSSQKTLVCLPLSAYKIEVIPGFYVSWYYYLFPLFPSLFPFPFGLKASGLDFIVYFKCQE